MAKGRKPGEPIVRLDAIPLSPLNQRFRAGIRDRPRGMDKLDITPDQGTAGQRIAMSIFTDMVNAGQTFQQAIAAVYFSGLSHAVSILQEKEKMYAAEIQRPEPGKTTSPKE